MSVVSEARCSLVHPDSGARSGDEFRVPRRSKHERGPVQWERSLLMSDNPTIGTRVDQPYAAIPVTVRMEELGSVVPPLTGQVFEWLAARGVTPAGPPFWGYVVIDMEKVRELEPGVVGTTPVGGDGEIRAGVLPAGRYATVVHTGHPDTLVTATRDLLDWAEKENLEWDRSEERRVGK